MALVFDNELYHMTEVAEEHILSGDDLPYFLQSDTLFEEVPYGNYRTDIAAVNVNPYRLGNRKEALGHVTPMPDGRKFRRSYREIQKVEPISRNDWIHEDGTYAEQTARESWDWLAEHDYLRVCSPSELGKKSVDESHYVTVKYPDVCDICAWELKQGDWEKALHQAKRAEVYAEYRMVLLDSGAIDEALENKSDFINSDVGLASLSMDGIEVHVRPSKRRTLRTTTRQLLNERALLELGDDTLQGMIREWEDH